MRPPPGHEERRPPQGAGVHGRRATKHFDTDSLAAAIDNAARQAAWDAWYTQDRITWEAETLVWTESLAQDALRSLTTQQLRDIRWVGLDDDGWRRMYRELDRRGEPLS